MFYPHSWGKFPTLPKHRQSVKNAAAVGDGGTDFNSVSLFAIGVGRERLSQNDMVDEWRGRLAEWEIWTTLPRYVSQQSPFLNHLQFYHKLVVIVTLDPFPNTLLWTVLLFIQPFMTA